VGPIGGLDDVAKRQFSRPARGQSLYRQLCRCGVTTNSESVPNYLRIIVSWKCILYVIQIIQYICLKYIFNINTEFVSAMIFVIRDIQ
jgi:hypothetical protein